jgi:hypothetical protein
MSAQTNRATELRWTCEVCGRSIRGSEGYLCASYREVAERERAIAEWEAHDRDPIASAEELSSYPNRVRWRIYHRACDPDLDDSAYWIGVERISHPGDALAWAAHLADKGWIEQHTDWAEILRGLAAQVGGSL